MSPTLAQSRRGWSTGDKIAAASSLLAGLSLLGSMAWGYARISYATETIPKIQEQQQINTLDIRQLKTQQGNSDARFQEILNQYNRLNDKIDRLQETRQ